MLTYVHSFGGFSSDDLDKTKQFYGEALGLPIEQIPQGLKLKLKGSEVFIYPKENHVPATFTVLNFVVEDIEQAVDELTAKGVQLEHYTDPIATDDKGIARGKKSGMGPDIAWFKDPAGNIIAILEQ